MAKLDYTDTCVRYDTNGSHWPFDDFNGTQSFIHVADSQVVTEVHDGGSSALAGRLEAFKITMDSSHDDGL